MRDPVLLRQSSTGNNGGITTKTSVVKKDDPAVEEKKLPKPPRYAGIIFSPKRAGVGSGRATKSITHAVSLPDSWLHYRQEIFPR